MNWNFLCPCAAMSVGSKFKRCPSHAGAVLRMTGRQPLHKSDLLVSNTNQGGACSSTRRTDSETTHPMGHRMCALANQNNSAAGQKAIGRIQ